MPGREEEGTLIKRRIWRDETMWKKSDSSREAQQERRKKAYEKLLELYRGKLEQRDGLAVAPFYDAEGSPDNSSRAPMWLAELFLEGDEKDWEIANDMIEGTRFGHACIFTGVACAEYLVGQKEKLRPAAVERMERYLLHCVADWMSGDVAFVGANDNFPIGCCTALSLCGQYFGNPAMIRFARGRLAELNQRLDYRGYLHECNSPTYSSISLQDISMLSELTGDCETKELALRIEQRIWQELLLHFHPAIRQQAGPFSRAYLDDTAGQGTMVTFSYYAAFGEISPYQPMNMLFPHPLEDTFAHNVWDFQYRSLIKIMGCTYHPPLELAEECLNRRQLPCQVEGSHEFMGISNSPGGQSNVSLYMEEKWGLGLFGSRTWQGQTTPVHLIYRRRETENGSTMREHMEAVRSAYTRMTVKGECDQWKDHMPNPDRDLELDAGAAFTVSHQGTMILGYVPCGAQDDRTATIRTAFVLPSFHSEPDEMRFGKELSVTGCASFERIDWCFVRDGEVYLGIYPLVSRKEPQLLSQVRFLYEGGYHMIAWYNMFSFEGKQLSLEELHTYGSGMVLEIGTEREYGSFQNFMDAVSGAEITDHSYHTERTITYQRGKTRLELMFDYTMVNLRRALSNGKLVSESASLTTEPKLPLVK